jgi:hypothetical protein
MSAQDLGMMSEKALSQVAEAMIATRRNQSLPLSPAAPGTGAHPVDVHRRSVLRLLHALQLPHAVVPLQSKLWKASAECCKQHS